MADTHSAIRPRTDGARKKRRQKTMKSGQVCRALCIAILSFSVEILVSFWLPAAALVVIEAVTIIGVGFKKKKKK